MTTQLAAPMTPTIMRIARMRKETADSFTIELNSSDGAAPYHFRAGQFNMLYLFGVGEAAISISGNPTKPEPLIHTIRAVGGVTRAIGELGSGELIGVRGPYGKPWPADLAIDHDVVIVAGGIGLAPLRPVLYQILAHRKKYKKVILLYGARTPDDILYRKEIEKWRSRLDLEVHVTVDRASGEWFGNVGVVTNLIPRISVDPAGTIAMICGPEIMMRFVALDLQQKGLKSEQIYVSMERNMKCGIGLCGHCQFGPTFICKDGPVFRYDLMGGLMTKREI